MTGPLGERFAHALAARDAATLKRLLAADVDFKALTPGEFWESGDASEVIDGTILGTWFRTERRIVETLAVESDRIGAVERVRYRFRVVGPDGESTIEQQAYYRTGDDRITWLRVMCTGFLPVDAL